MIRFRQYLEEVFDSSLPYTKDPHHQFAVKYGYHVYKFNATKDPNLERQVLIVHGEGDHKDHASVEFMGSNGRFDRGNHKGTSHKVFSTVKKIIHDHLAAHPHIKHVNFSADTDTGKHTSLANVYDKILRKSGHDFHSEKSGDYRKDFTVKVRR